jgi:hypothetical protein
MHEAGSSARSAKLMQFEVNSLPMSVGGLGLAGNEGNELSSFPNR